MLISDVSIFSTTLSKFYFPDQSIRFKDTKTILEFFNSSRTSIRPKICSATRCARWKKIIIPRIKRNGHVYVFLFFLRSRRGFSQRWKKTTLSECALHAFHERYTRIFATDHDTGLSRDTQCLAVSRSNVSINTRGNFLAVSRLDIEHRA